MTATTPVRSSEIRKPLAPDKYLFAVKAASFLRTNWGQFCLGVAIHGSTSFVAFWRSFVSIFAAWMVLAKMDDPIRTSLDNLFFIFLPRHCSCVRNAAVKKERGACPRERGLLLGREPNRRAEVAKPITKSGDKHIKTTGKYVGPDVHKDTVIAVAEAAACCLRRCGSRRAWCLLFQHKTRKAAATRRRHSRVCSTGGLW